MNGETALAMAVKRNWVKVIGLLLINGAFPNVQNNTGATALLMVMRENDMAITCLIITNGANPNVQSRYGGTTLVVTANNDHIDAVNILLTNCQKVVCTVCTVHSFNSINPTMRRSSHQGVPPFLGYSTVISILTQTKPTQISGTIKDALV